MFQLEYENDVDELMKALEKKVKDAFLLFSARIKPSTKIR